MSSSSGGVAAIVVGTLAIAAVPAGVAAAWRLEGVSLIEATKVTVPAGFVLGLIGITIARRARFRVDRSVGRKGARLVRVGRALSWIGVYLAVAGAVALGFYALLEVRG
jgi:hypothetical protein